MRTCKIPRMAQSECENRCWQAVLSVINLIGLRLVWHNLGLEMELMRLFVYEPCQAAKGKE